MFPPAGFTASAPSRCLWRTQTEGEFPEGNMHRVCVGEGACGREQVGGGGGVQSEGLALSRAPLSILRTLVQAPLCGLSRGSTEEQRPQSFCTPAWSSHDVTFATF